MIIKYKQLTCNRQYFYIKDGHHQCIEKGVAGQKVLRAMKEIPWIYFEDNPKYTHYPKKVNKM